MRDGSTAFDLFDYIGNPEFREVWSDTWMFALLAVYAAASLPGDPPEQLPIGIARVLLSGRRALAFSHPDDAPLHVWRLVARACAGP